MHRFRTVMIGGAVAALVLTASAGPAVAGSNKTRLAIVNGIAAKTIDVCINGREVKSRLPFGKKVFKTTKTSSAKIKFYAHDARKCKGKLLGKKTVFFDDATVVVTRKKPKKVLVFDNSTLGTLGTAADPPDYAGAMRQASDADLVGWIVSETASNPVPWLPASDEWDKGRELTWTRGVSWNGNVITLWVTRTHSSFWYLGPKFRLVRPGYRYEWIFVGDMMKGYRLVTFKRPVTFGP